VTVLAALGESMERKGLFCALCSEPGQPFLTHSQGGPPGFEPRYVDPETSRQRFLGAPVFLLITLKLLSFHVAKLTKGAKITLSDGS